MQSLCTFSKKRRATPQCPPPQVLQELLLSILVKADVIESDDLFSSEAKAEVLSVLLDPALPPLFFFCIEGGLSIHSWFYAQLIHAGLELLPAGH